MPRLLDGFKNIDEEFLGIDFLDEIDENDQSKVVDETALKGVNVRLNNWKKKFVKIRELLEDSFGEPKRSKRITNDAIIGKNYYYYNLRQEKEITNFVNILNIYLSDEEKKVLTKKLNYIKMES